MRVSVLSSVLLLALGAQSIVGGDAASGQFKTKGKTFPLKHAFAYTTEGKVTVMGKERAEKTLHVILSDKPFDTVALGGETDPNRAIMRQAKTTEASYLDIRMDSDGKLKEVCWCPDYRTGLNWEGTPGEGTLKLQLSRRDAKQVAGLLKTESGTHAVDWVADLRFDAPSVQAVR